MRSARASYYQWRDKFLANAAKAFDPAGAPQRQGRLERENAHLKILVGEFALDPMFAALSSSSCSTGTARRWSATMPALQARAWHWLVALNRAVNRQFPHGIEGQSLNLMADNGCQPTSLAFMRACAAMGIRQAFTSYSNPKGNADTERFLRTLKEELVWLHEWTSPAVFFAALERWITTYSAGYLHSALGYRSPEAFEAEHLSHATPLPAAC